MQHLISIGVKLIKGGLVLMFLVGMVSAFSPSAIAEAAFAPALPPKQALEEIRQDLATQDRATLYEAEAPANKNPKMEIEKKYEENLKEFVKENPDQGGVIDKVKDLLTTDP